MGSHGTKNFKNMGWDGMGQLKKKFRSIGWDDLLNFPSRPIPSHVYKNFLSHGTDGMGWDCPIPRRALIGTLCILA